ncbi:hypothetical protein GQR58_000182 [Nymphon striatum]|nr:hypothetical protein GQR58_000182 [Nymphon striatum]
MPVYARTSCTRQPWFKSLRTNPKTPETPSIRQRSIRFPNLHSESGFAYTGPCGRVSVDPRRGQRYGRFFRGSVRSVSSHPIRRSGTHYKADAHAAIFSARQSNPSDEEVAGDHRRKCAACPEKSNLERGRIYRHGSPLGNLRAPNGGQPVRPVPMPCAPA